MNHLCLILKVSFVEIFLMCYIVSIKFGGDFLCQLKKATGVYLPKSKAHSTICINTENFHYAWHFDEEGAAERIIYSQNTEFWCLDEQ